MNYAAFFQTHLPCSAVALERVEGYSKSRYDGEHNVQYYERSREVLNSMITT